MPGLDNSISERGTEEGSFDLAFWARRWLEYLGNRYQLNQAWMTFVERGDRVDGWPLDIPLPDHLNERSEYASLSLINKGIVLGRLVVHAGEPPLQGIVEELRSLLPVLAHELSFELDRHRALQAERRIVRLLQSTLDISSILPVVLQEVAALLKADAAMISAKTSFDGNNKGVLASFGFNDREAEQAGLITMEGMEDDRGGNFVWLHGKPRDDFQTILVLPLTGKNPPAAVMKFFWRDQHSRDLKDGGESDEIFREITLALERSVLYAEVRQAAQSGVQHYHAMVEGLTKVLGLRDHETEEHTRRVSQITMQFAKHLQIPSEQWSGIQSGALLHDIGKLGVPDAILLKPGSLTTPERQMMQMHVIYGHTILAPFTADQQTLDIVMHHHERWDGGGYPQGIQGERIPWVARMFSVVDVFDALTSDRPYRTAWLHTQALEFIKEEAGRQFDPHLVSCFLEIADKLV